MAIELFAPKRKDGRAYWRVLFDHIEDRVKRGDLTIGDLIPHRELRDLLDDSAQGQYQSTVSRTAQELRERYGRSLESVRGQGYKLIAGMAQADQGAEYKRKGQRALRRGVKILATVDQRNLSHGERSVFNQMQRNMVLLTSAVGRTWEELDRHSEQLSVLAQQRVEDRTELKGDIEELQRQLDELKRGRTA